ncbi:DNA recombination protein RmuC [Candidatus Xenohaliotis californiensis]|uniref:DNA recombination protein RmuC homolog n=1 Tax=Candidatus Xenohaliotis californiensis TaxID=84677 RepID=A0ABM9N870_9RICK|nr:DNA recombination protein RmuC [Candidatus Xenohaliotis californiensis]
MMWFFLGAIFCFMFLIAYGLMHIKMLRHRLANALGDLENIRAENRNLELERDDFRNKFNRVEAKLEEVRTTKDEYDRMRRENAEHIVQRLSEKVGAISGDQLLRNAEESTKKLKETLIPVDELRKEFRQEMEDFKKSRVVSEELDRVKQDAMQNVVSNMTKLANDFIKACKGDSKAAGEFGEQVLEMCLENSGLHKGEHYRMQSSLVHSSGDKGRPDVIVNLPENRHLVIDSKVSLFDYKELIDAERGSDEEKRLLNSFNQSVRRHVRDLKERCYSNAQDINSPDFVVMFVPMESALQMIMHGNLWFDAQKEGVIIVSPTTLSVVLKVVNSLWNFEKRNANVEEIMRIVESMYQKFSNICNGWIKVGDRLRTVATDYNMVTSRLTGAGGLYSKMLAIEKKSGVVWGGKSLRNPQSVSVDIDSSSLHKAIEDVD